MRKSGAIAVLCLLVGLGAGYVLGLWRGRTAAHAEDEVAVAKRVVQTALETGSYGSITNREAEALVAWSKVDPRAALDALAKAARVGQRNRMLLFPLAELARQDVGAVIDWLRSNMQEPDRSEEASMLVDRLRGPAPRAAVALMLERDLKVEESAFPYVLGALAKIDPPAALDSWEKLGRIQPQYSLVCIAEGYVAEDADAAIRWAVSLRETADAKYAAEGILHGLIKVHPDRVKEANTRLGLSHDALCAAVEGMVHRAPDGVVATLPLLEPAEATGVARKVVSVLMNSHPARALALARERLSVSEGNMVLAKAWKSWREFDSKAASDWARTVTDPELKQALQEIERSDAAKYQPETVLVEQANLPLETISYTLIGRALSSATTPVALHWLEEHPERVDPDLVRLIAMNSVTADDPDNAMLAWAKRMPTRLRNSALHGVAAGWIYHNQMERAAAVAAEMEDCEERTGLYFSLFAAMRQKDQQQAYDWLDKLPLSSEIRGNWKVIIRESMAAEVVPFFD